MGGHGGLNILPQKKWNVYNFDNREKVKQDEEAAAKEEQLKREQSRKKDAEFRLEQLRTARGLAPLLKSSESSQTVQVANSHQAVVPEPEAVVPESESEPQSNHINLFEGIKIFDPVSDLVSGGGEGKRKRRTEEEEKGGALKKMKKKEDPPRTVGPEDEKYRLGYGIAGKGVKLPWYMSKPSVNDSNKADDRTRIVKEKSKISGRKTLEELREERLRREKKEKERERALIVEKKSSRRDYDRSGSNKRDFSRRKAPF